MDRTFLNEHMLEKARYLSLGASVAMLPHSVRYCHLPMLLFLLLCIPGGPLAHRVAEFFRSPIAWILPAFFLLHAIGMLYSGNWQNAVANLDKKIAFVLIPPLAATVPVISRSVLHGLMLVFVTSCFAATAMGILNAWLMAGEGSSLWHFGPSAPYLQLHPDASGIWTYFSYRGLSAGAGLHPTYFSIYCLVCMLILAHFRSMVDLRRGERFVATGFMIYFAVFIAMLSSRIMVLATVLVLLAAVAIHVRGLGRPLAAVILAILLTVLIVNPVAMYRNTQEYSDANLTSRPGTTADNPVSIRTSLWQTSRVAMAGVNPLTGMGTGDVNDYLAATGQQLGLRNVHNTSDPHNQYIHTYLALGVPGLILLIGVLMVPFLCHWGTGSLLACLGMASFMMAGMTESVLELQKGILPYSLFVALTANQIRDKFPYRNSLRLHPLPIHHEV